MSALRKPPIGHIKDRGNYAEHPGDYFYEESGEEGKYYIYYLKNTKRCDKLIKQVIHDRNHARKIAVCIDGVWHWEDALRRKSRKRAEREEAIKNKKRDKKVSSIEKSINRLFEDLNKCDVRSCIVRTDLGGGGGTLTSIKHEEGVDPDLATAMSILCSNYAPNIDLFMINLMKYCETNNIDTSKSMVFKMLKDMPQL